MDETLLLEKLNRMEQRQRIAYTAAIILVVAFSLLFLLQWRYIHAVAHPDTLSLRRLNIVDQRGISRVILAAPVPQPIILGKQHNRGGDVSGVIIADATGTERGGYVTSDGEYANAFLTLDGQGKQTVLLLAEPQGPTLFRIWNKDRGSLTMGVSDANPYLNVRQGTKLFFDSPAGNPQSKDTRPLFR